MPRNPDPELRPHKGPFLQATVAGIPGLIMALGIMAIVLIGLPRARLWLVTAPPAGIVFAAVIYWWRNRRGARNEIEECMLHLEDTKPRPPVRAASSDPVQKP